MDGHVGVVSHELPLGERSQDSWRPLRPRQSGDSGCYESSCQECDGSGQHIVEGLKEAVWRKKEEKMQGLAAFYSRSVTFATLRIEALQSEILHAKRLQQAASASRTARVPPIQRLSRRMKRMLAWHHV